MSFLYKYTDKNDNIVKYIGIVYNRSLSKRIKEHEYDNWFDKGDWKIEYITLQSRTDAEFLEAHFISFYQTYLWYNVCKKSWGTSNLISNTNLHWKLYTKSQKAQGKLNAKKTNDYLQKTKYSIETDIKECIERYQCLVLLYDNINKFGGNDFIVSQNIPNNILYEAQGNQIKAINLVKETIYTKSDEYIISLSYGTDSIHLLSLIRETVDEICFKNRNIIPNLIPLEISNTEKSNFQYTTISDFIKKQKGETICQTLKRN